MDTLSSLAILPPEGHAWINETRVMGLKVYSSINLEWMKPLWWDSNYIVDQSCSPTYFCWIALEIIILESTTSFILYSKCLYQPIIWLTFFHVIYIESWSVTVVFWDEFSKYLIWLPMLGFYSIKIHCWWHQCSKGMKQKD